MLACRPELETVMRLRRGFEFGELSLFGGKLNGFPVKGQDKFQREI